MDNVARLPVVPTSTQGDDPSIVTVDLNDTVTSLLANIEPVTITMLACMLQPLLSVWVQKTIIRLTGKWRMPDGTGIMYTSGTIPASSSRNTHDLLLVKMRREETEIPDAPAEFLELRNFFRAPYGVTGQQVNRALRNYRYRHGGHYRSLLDAAGLEPVVTAEVPTPDLAAMSTGISNITEVRHTAPP